MLVADTPSRVRFPPTVDDVLSSSPCFWPAAVKANGVAGVEAAAADAAAGATGIEDLLPPNNELFAPEPKQKYKIMRTKSIAKMVY